MTRKVFGRCLEILGVILLIVAVIIAPFITASIENPVYRTMVWVSFVLLILIFAFSIGLMPYWGMREMKRDMEKEKDIVEKRLYAIVDLEERKKVQYGNEKDWLRPVIEWIDIKRPSLASNEVMVKYQIDSGLLYPFKPKRMWLKLNLGDYEPGQGYEVTNFGEFLAGKRTPCGSEKMTITDEGLLKRINGIRQGAEMKQVLKVILQLREGENPVTLEAYSLEP